MKKRRHKKAEKLQPKRAPGFAIKGMPSSEASKQKGQMGSVKVRTRIGGKSYEASISEEILLKAWRTIMKDEE
nr:hypothetical protein [uncultured Porphyromonas sp.]